MFLQQGSHQGLTGLDFTDRDPVHENTATCRSRLKTGHIQGQTPHHHDTKLLGKN